MIICLIGFMGCGKSSVGRKLSQLLCYPFIDLDQMIEETQGRSITEIFATDGESAFRQLELQGLKSIRPTSKTEQMILALGGGTVMTPECAAIVHAQTLCIYLRASIETLMSHLADDVEERPLLNVPCNCEESKGQRSNLLLQDRIATLMADRSATYEKTAHIIIDTNGKSIETIAEEIVKEVLRVRGSL